MSPADPSAVGRLSAPTLEDIEALADAAFQRLPAQFRDLCEGLVIQVVDFADDETLDEMGVESEFDLLGLFRGRGLPDRGANDETGRIAQHDLALSPAAARLLVRRRGPARGRRHPCPRA